MTRTDATGPEAWLEDHGDALYRYALRHVRDAHAAEDLVQETLVSALKARGNFAGRSALRTWLTGILRHKIVDYFRRRVRETAAPPDGGDAGNTDGFFSGGRWSAPPAPWPDPGRDLQNRELREALDACIAALPATPRAAFRLRTENGLDAASVCKVLNISTTHLYAALSRARLALRHCLEGSDFGGTF